MTTGPVWCVQQSLYCDNWSGVVCSTVCTVTTGPVWCVQQSLYCDNWSGVVCSTESVL